MRPQPHPKSRIALSLFNAIKGLIELYILKAIMRPIFMNSEISSSPWTLFVDIREEMI